jgi:predicted dinucleotide-binding enzyme
MRIGILGSGRMGAKLGTLFARAGHQVTFSYSRSGPKLKRLASAAGSGARAGTVREATQDAEAILLAVHWSRVREVLKQAGDLEGKTVISCCLPMDATDARLVVSGDSSGAERLAKWLPKARVIGAFGTVPSEVLLDVYAARRRKARPSLVYYGDHPAAKRLAARLIRDVGFEPVDAGPLKTARYAEPFTLLVAQLAYEGKGGPRLAYRFERFAG